MYLFTYFLLILFQNEVKSKYITYLQKKYGVLKNKYARRYPRWPQEFKWSYSGPIAGYNCLQIVEPSEPASHHWSDNYFCVKTGSNLKEVAMKWSYSGPIKGMRCTNVIEPADPHHWGDNFICVPTNTPYRFSYSNAGPLPGSKCIQWNEPSDPHTWQDNFLCRAKTVQRYPRWPQEFKWSYSGPIAGYNCLQIVEPSEPASHHWTDNYFCVKTGSNLKEVAMKWSYSGPIKGMRCTNVIEPADPHHWGDNFICVPTNTPYRFSYSNAGPLPGKDCIQWNEPSDPHTWNDNFVCHENTGFPHWPGDFKFSLAVSTNSDECVSVKESIGKACDADSKDYSFCWKKSPKMMSPGIQWSDRGPIRGMNCIPVNKPSKYGSKMYLCVPRKSPFNFVSSTDGKVSGLECLSWEIPGAKNQHNYVCHRSS